MTIVAALSSSRSSILIADSRITYPDVPGAPTDHKDIGQKVIRLGREGLVGFSGDVESAHRVLRGFSGTYKMRGLSWIKSESEVRNLFNVSGISPNDPAVSILCTFVDLDHEVMPGIPGAVLITFNSKTAEYSKKYLGLSVIGSGAQVKKSIEAEPGVTGLLGFPRADDHPRTLVHKAMFMAEVMAVSAKSEAINDIGGLFQIHYVTREGVFAVPYRRWVSIGDAHGTYVQMDIDDQGRWVQIHEPTGRRIPLGLLGQDVIHYSTRNLVFDLQSELDPTSPGVVKKQNPQSIYEPTGDDWDVRTPGD